jgi:hypothetical protein
VPLGRRAARPDQLHIDPEAAEVERRPLRRHLLEALVVGAVAERDGARPLRDAGRLVERRVADAAAQPRGLVAVRVIGDEPLTLVTLQPIPFDLPTLSYEALGLSPPLN